MTFTNLCIVTRNGVIENGYLRIENGLISDFGLGQGPMDAKRIDKSGLTAYPGFVDIHVHGSAGIDFMDASPEEYETIAASLYEEGVTTFLATTLTSGEEALAKVCESAALAKEKVPSLGGIHFEGPYISEKYKGAQNPEFIRDPSIEEFDRLQKIAGGLIRYISLAPEKSGAMEFIRHVTKQGVHASAGHTDASFACVEEAIKQGLDHVTHTHNAMSPHHHRNPGVVTAAMYFEQLFTEVICDKVHVCPDTLRTFYRIVGPDRFVAITDALKVKHSDIQSFQLFGLDCVRKQDAAYLTSGPLAGSLLSMDQAFRNLKEVTGASPVELSKMTSTNAAKGLGFDDRGVILQGKLADLVLLDANDQVQEVYKLGERVK